MDAEGGMSALVFLSWGIVFGAIHAASLLELSAVVADKVLARGRDVERLHECDGTLLTEALIGNEPIDCPIANGTEGGGEGRGTEGGGPLDNFSDDESARCMGAGRFKADAFGKAL